MKGLRSGISKVLLLIAVSIILLSGCGGNKVLKQYEGVTKNAPTATIKTSKGDIKVVLFPKEAPKAVENFISLAKAGTYDGVLFHRVISNFMIQSGDTDFMDGFGGESIWGKPFKDEFSDNLWNFRGALSMANSGPNTNGSQFFIVQAPSVEEIYLKMMELNMFPDEKKPVKYPPEVINKYRENGGTPWLDKQHTVFGHVIEGMDVVDAIAKVETNEMGKPLEDVTIITIEVNE